MAQFVSIPTSSEIQSEVSSVEQSPHYSFDHAKPFNKEKAGHLDAMTNALRTVMGKSTPEQDAARLDKVQRFTKILHLLRGHK